MKRRTLLKVLFCFIAVCGIVVIVLSFSSHYGDKNTHYLKEISYKARNSDVYCDLYLSRYVKEQNRFVTYKSVINNSTEKRYILDILKLTDTLTKDSQLQDKSKYTIEMIIIFETKNKSQPITYNINPDTLNVYIPELDCYYKLQNSSKALYES